MLLILQSPNRLTVFCFLTLNFKIDSKVVSPPCRLNLVVCMRELQKFCELMSDALVV